MMSFVYEVYRVLRPGGLILVLLLVVSTVCWARGLWWMMENGAGLFRGRNAGTGEDPKEGIPDLDRFPSEIRETLRTRQKSVTLERSKRLRGDLNRALRNVRHRLSSGLFLVDAGTRALPLLGLLGTILGILETFEVLALLGPGSTARMSEGISRALITTQAGLLLAIPLFLLHGYMQSRIRKRIRRLRVQLHRVLIGETGKLDESSQILSDT